MIIMIKIVQSDTYGRCTCGSGGQNKCKKAQYFSGGEEQKMWGGVGGVYTLGHGVRKKIGARGGIWRGEVIPSSFRNFDHPRDGGNHLDCPDRLYWLLIKVSSLCKHIRF